MQSLLEQSIATLRQQGAEVPKSLWEALQQVRGDTPSASLLVKPKPHGADENEECTMWEIIRMCLPPVAVSVGWSIGETLLTPYLISLGLSESICNMVWLANPLLGVFLQPMFGHWSDKLVSSWGRRR